MNIPIRQMRHPTSQHLPIFFLAVFMIMGSLWLSRSSSGELGVWLPFWNTTITVPEVCVLRLASGVPCPGCGLMRSFSSTAAGDWTAAVRFHPMGPVLFLLCVGQIPYRIILHYGLVDHDRGSKRTESLRFLMSLLIVVGFLITWLFRTCAGCIGHP